MNPEQRRLLADLLIQWEDLYKQGQDTPAEVLCKDYPDLVETLTRQIAALKRVAWLDKKLEDDGDEPGEDSPDDPRPPKLLAGRYRLDQLIATGGFAEVWRAFDEELQRIIAVKIPKPTVVGSSESFLAEARRVARLKHPAILPVYDIGLEGNDCFFVSEYVEGGSLADRLVKGPLSPDQACRWITSIAEALNYAHASGVIHRDVKPANILIDAHDRALLTDFGIAQSSMKTGEFAPSIGTLRYMAPEQLDAQSAVPQSDIYSLAVVLHEALAGKPPYSSGEPNTLRREIGTGATISRDIPQRLVPVLRKALNKDPGQRFGSAAEFAAALRRPLTTSWRKAAVFTVTAALLLAALTWVGLGYGNTRPQTHRHDSTLFPRNQISLFLSDLPEHDVVVNFDFGKNGNCGYFNRLIRVNDIFAAKGLSTHCLTGAPVGVTYDVPQNARRFMSVVAITDDVATQVNNYRTCGSPITFRVLGDGDDVLWTSPRPITEVGEIFPCNISVVDTKTIRLEARCAGLDGWCCAVWLNPCFVANDSEVPDALKPWWVQDGEDRPLAITTAGPVQKSPLPPMPSARTTPPMAVAEMPYPLPPYNRREWRSQPPDSGLVYRFDETSGWWLSYREPGPIEYRFQQTRVGDDGIHLDDPSRKMWITLTGTACNSRASPTYPHNIALARGAWVNESDSPYPPQFDQTVTITSTKDTLEAYIRLLAHLSGVPITINVSALQMEGITKNQSFGLDERDQPARNVLEAILAKADTQGRLRAILRATDDGKTAIDITTRQALEEQH